MSAFKVMVSMVGAMVLGSFLLACESTVPGAPGEACNYAAEGSDGCDDSSICTGGTCIKLCSSEATRSSECGGGACVVYERIFDRRQFTA
jgi:hypothetical protein